MPDKRHPEASTLFYLYAAVADYILQAWEGAARELRPKHMSLHFDGMRLGGLESDTSSEELCQHFQERIKRVTCFHVVIVEKTFCVAGACVEDPSWQLWLSARTMLKLADSTRVPTRKYWRLLICSQFPATC